MSSRKTIDEQARDESLLRGIQPSVGSIGQMTIRNPRVEYKNDPTVRRGGDTTRRAAKSATVATGVATEVTGAGMQVAGQTANIAGSVALRAGVALSGTGIGAVVGVPLAATGALVKTAGVATKQAGKAVRKTGKRIRKSAKAIGAASTQKTTLETKKRLIVHRFISAWAWPSWLLFQLPFAILSLVMFIVAAALAEFISFITPTIPKETDSYWLSAIKTVASTTFDYGAAVLSFINDKVFGFFGIDLTILDPTNFFLITYVMVFAYGMLVLMAIYFILNLALLNPLSGKGAGLKWGMLLLAVIGYSMPVLNLFPWFYPWKRSISYYSE